MRPLLLALLALTTLSAAAQNIGPYEQILVPFDTMNLVTASGRWRSELWARNNGSAPVNIWAQECFRFGQPVACSRRMEVPAGKTLLLDGFEPDGAAPGVLLYIPRGRSSDVTFNLRVRDLSRGLDDLGTELPVVREAEMKSGRVSLINVPLQPNARIHLRLYAPHPQAAFTVRMFAEPAGEVLAQAIYASGTPADGSDPAELPLMIDASSIFRGWIIDRVHVTVEMMMPQNGTFFPLLTITNQRNNHVTTVTPQ